MDKTDEWPGPGSQDESTSCSEPQPSREGGQSNITTDLHGQGEPPLGTERQQKPQGGAGRNPEQQWALTEHNGELRFLLPRCSLCDNNGRALYRNGPVCIQTVVVPQIYEWEKTAWNYKRTATSVCKTGDNWIRSVGQSTDCINISFLVVTLLQAVTTGESWGKGSLNSAYCCCLPEHL